MNKIMTNLIILFIAGTIIGSIGQIFLKKGLIETGQIDMNINILPYTIFKIITNKFVFLGILLSVFAAFIGLILLSQNNLSFIYPVGVGLLFITVLLLSKIFLKETIYLSGWIGVLLIISGVITIFYSKQ